MMVSFVLSFFPRDVLDEILNLIESVSEDFPSYSFTVLIMKHFFMEKVFHAKTHEERTAQSTTPDVNALTYRNEPKLAKADHIVKCKQNAH